MKTKKRFLLIGIDGLSPELSEILIDQRCFFFLEKVRKEGVWGRLTRERLTSLSSLKEVAGVVEKFFGV